MYNSSELYDTYTCGGLSACENAGKLLPVGQDNQTNGEQVILQRSSVPRGVVQWNVLIKDRLRDF